MLLALRTGFSLASCTRFLFSQALRRRRRGFTAATAHIKSSSPVPVRLLCVQHLQLRCLERHSSPSTQRKLHCKNTSPHYKLILPCEAQGFSWRYAQCFAWRENTGEYKVARKSFGPWAPLQNSEWASLGPTVAIGMGPLVNFGRCPIRRMGLSNMGLCFLSLGRLFWRSKHMAT